MIFHFGWHFQTPSHPPFWSSHHRPRWLVGHAGTNGTAHGTDEKPDLKGWNAFPKLVLFAPSGFESDLLITSVRSSPWGLNNILIEHNSNLDSIWPKSKCFKIRILLGESETEGLKLCRKGDPLQRVGYLTLRNDLLEEASALTEEEAESGREPGGRQLGRGPGRAALPCGSQSQVLWWRGQFPGCLRSITPTQGPSCWHTCHSARTDSSEKDSGSLAGRMDWALLSSFDLSQFFWLVVVCQFQVLTRTSGCETTHASGHYRGWSVSVSGSPNSGCRRERWFPAFPT